MATTAVRADCMVNQVSADLFLLDKAEKINSNVVEWGQKAVFGAGQQYEWLQSDTAVSVDLRKEFNKRVIQGAIAGAVGGGILWGALLYFFPWLALLTWKRIALFAVCIFGGAAAGGVAVGMFKLNQLSQRNIYKIWLKKKAQSEFSRESLSKQAVESISAKVDRTLIDPITGFFPMVPATIRGQVYETAGLIRWVTKNPDGNNSPLRDGHIALEDIHYDMNYYPHFCHAMRALKASKVEWMTNDVVGFVDGEMVNQQKTEMPSDIEGFVEDEIARQRDARNDIIAHIGLSIINARNKKQINNNDQMIFHQIIEHLQAGAAG